MPRSIPLTKFDAVWVAVVVAEPRANGLNHDGGVFAQVQGQTPWKREGGLSYLTHYYWLKR